MLNEEQAIAEAGEENMISARVAAKILGLSHTALFTALEAKTIISQIKIEGDNELKPIFGFDQEYIEAIAKLLPKNHTPRKKIFTPDLKKEIEKVNSKWRGRKIKLD